jgi:hypothetical protein
MVTASVQPDYQGFNEAGGTLPASFWPVSAQSVPAFPACLRAAQSSTPPSANRYTEASRGTTVGSEARVTIWMFATSVVYPLDRVGGSLGRVLLLNPMTAIIDGYRAVFVALGAPRAFALDSRRHLAADVSDRMASVSPLRIPLLGMHLARTPA